MQLWWKRYFELSSTNDYFVIAIIQKRQAWMRLFNMELLFLPMGVE
jgi:hypothetical protein